MSSQLPAYVRFQMRDHTYTATVHSVEDLDRWSHENHNEIVSFSIEQTGSINPDSIRDAVLKTRCLRCVSDSDSPHWTGKTEHIHTTTNREWTPTEIPKRVTVSARGGVVATYQIAGVKWTPHGWSYCCPAGHVVAPVLVQLFSRTLTDDCNAQGNPEPTHYTFDW